MKRPWSRVFLDSDEVEESLYSISGNVSCDSSSVFSFKNATLGWATESPPVLNEITIGY